MVRCRRSFINIWVSRLFFRFFNSCRIGFFVKRGVWRLDSGRGSVSIVLGDIVLIYFLVNLEIGDGFILVKFIR